MTYSQIFSGKNLKKSRSRYFTRCLMGCTALVASSLMPPVAEATLISLEQLVSSADSMPDTVDHYNFINNIDFTNSGLVFFSAGDNGSSSSNSQGLFSVSDLGVVTIIARIGVGPFTFSKGIPHNGFVANNAGEVAFDIWREGFGIHKKSPNSPLDEITFLSNDHTANIPSGVTGAGNTGAFHIVATTKVFDLIDNGQIFFKGSFGSLGDGIFTGTNTGDIRNIVYAGDPAAGLAGATFVDFFGLQAREDGVSYFTASVTGSGFSNNTGIWRDQNGVQTLIYKAGDPIPGMAGLTFFGDPKLTVGPNNLVILHDNAKGQTANSGFDALWLGSDAANLSILVRTTSNNVDNLTTTDQGQVAFREIGTVLYSENGDIYFTGKGNIPPQTIGGIWKRDGVTGEISLFIEETSSLHNFVLLDTNSKGEIVYSAGVGQFFPFEKAIMFADSKGVTTEIAKTGKVIDSVGRGPGSFSDVQLNDNSQVALIIRFGRSSNSATEGVFLATLGAGSVSFEFFWDGACGDTNWHSSCADSNWLDANRLPAGLSPGDTAGTESVTIVNKNVVISDRAVHLDTLSATGSLEVNQALTLEGLSSIEDLTLKADLTANAALSLTGINNVWNDGVISGTGIVTVDNGAVFTLSPTGGSLDLKTTLKILGDAKQTGGTLNLGAIGNVTINLNGKYELMEGNIASNPVSAANFINGGVFLKSGDTTSIIEAFFENQASGEIKVDAGALTFNGPNILAGNIIVASGARAEFSGSVLATELNGLSVTGQGVIVFSDEIFLKDDTTSIFTLIGENGKAVIADGTKIKGTGTLENSGNLEFSGAAELQTTLKVTGGDIDQFGDLTLHGVDAKIQVLDVGQYNFYGNSNLLASMINGDALILDGFLVKKDTETASRIEVDVKHISSTLDVNVGTKLAITGTQTFSVGQSIFRGDGTLLVGNMSTDGGTLDNNITGDGALLLTGATILTGGKLINNGNIDWQVGKITGGVVDGTTATNGLQNNDSGKLTISAPVLLQDGVIDNFGTVNVRQNLTINGGVILNQKDATIDIGALGNISSLDGGLSLIENSGGTLKKSGGLVSQISASYTSDGGTTSVTSGILQFKEGVTFKEDSKVSVDAGDRLELRNGETRVTGLFTITGDGTFQIGGDTFTLDVAVLTNEGNIEWSGGVVDAGNPAGFSVFNTGSFTLTDPGAVHEYKGLLLNKGNVTVQAGVTLDMSSSGAKIANRNDAIFTAGGSINNSGGGLKIFNNDMATFKFDSPAGSIIVTTSEFDNLGTVEVLEDTTVTIDRVKQLPLNNLMDGTWIVRPGSELTIKSIVLNFPSAIDTIGEKAKVVIYGSGKLNNLPETRDSADIDDFLILGTLELREGAIWRALTPIALGDSIGIANDHPGGIFIIDPTSTLDLEVLSINLSSGGVRHGIRVSLNSSLLMDGILNLKTLNHFETIPDILIEGGLFGTGTISVNYLVNGDSSLLHPGTIELKFPNSKLSGSLTINSKVINNGRVIPGFFFPPGSLTSNSHVKRAAVIPSPPNPIGIMTINGDYTQTSTGVLAIELGGFEAGTEYDQLIVNGTATFEAGSSIEITLLDLDGDGKVFIPKGRSSFDIIVSDNLILPTGADLANLVSVTNAPNGLRVSLAPSGVGEGFGFKLLTVFGSTLLDLSSQFTPGQTMVAGALDGASTGTATDGLLDFALAIDDLSSVSAKQDALEQASLSFASSLFAMSRIGSDAAHNHLGRHFDSMIWAVAENNDRMASIKNGAANNLITMSYGQKNQPGAFNDANDVMRFAKNFADNAGGSTALASGGGLKVFVAGSYEFGNYDATLNQTGFDYSGAAVSLGMEYNNREQGLTFGVAGSVSTLNGTIDLGRGAVDSTTYGLSAYGLVQIAESAALDVTVSYGNVKNSYRRAVTIPGQAFTATGDANGNYLTGTARFAYAIEAGNGKIGPYGQIRYSRISLDGFSETGGGDASLIIGKGIEKFVTGQIGLRATLPMRTSIGYVIPRFSAGWNYILDQTSPTLAAHFVGGPDDSFSILTDNYSRNGLAINAGLTIQSSDVLRFSVDYQGLLFNKDHGEHSLVGRARWMF